MATFKSLTIGETFNFVSSDRMLNSFYLTCTKISPRKYRDEHGTEYTVSSVNCEVYHINEKN